MDKQVLCIVVALLFKKFEFLLAGPQTKHKLNTSPQW